MKGYDFVMCKRGPFTEESVCAAESEKDKERDLAGPLGIPCFDDSGPEKDTPMRLTI